MTIAQAVDLPLRPEEDQASFFAAVLERSRRACEQTGERIVDLQFPIGRLRLVFAGHALEDLLLPALAHRQVPVEGTADAEFVVWDSASTGIDAPPPPVAKRCFTDRGDIWTFRSARYRSAFHYSDGTLNLFDVERRSGVLWMKSADDVPYWTRAAPLRTLLHWWAQSRGACLVHAAAVGTAQGCVLLTGPGGVGKSSTALQALADGLDFLGDDFVLLTADPVLTAHSLYRTAKIDAADMARFARFDPRLPPSSRFVAEPKAVIHVDAGLRDSSAVTAILLPTVDGSEHSAIAPIDRGELLNAACFSTVALLPHAGQEAIAFLATAVDGHPSFRLLLGQERRSTADVLRDVIARPRPIAASPAPVPRISVVIPAFNAAHLIGDALASIREQGVDLCEVIVVDDGSADDLAGALSDSGLPLRLIRQENRGAAAARNAGVRAAAGDIIAFLDADDHWPPWMLSVLLAALRNRPSADVFLGRAVLVAGSRQEQTFLCGPDDTFDWYFGSALYRRAAFRAAGPIDEQLGFAEDLDWFLAAVHAGLRIERIGAITLHVRRHGRNSSKGRSLAELLPLRMLANEAKRQRRNPDPRALAMLYGERD